MPPDAQTPAAAAATPTTDISGLDMSMDAGSIDLSTAASLLARSRNSRGNGTGAADKGQGSPSNPKGTTEGHPGPDASGQAGPDDDDDVFGDASEEDGEDQSGDVHDETDDDGSEDGPHDAVTVLDENNNPVRTTVEELLKGRKFKIGSGDDAAEVDFKELQDGYVRRSDHTRRLQDLAKARHQIESQAETFLDEARAKASEYVRPALETAKVLEKVFVEPDWARLAANPEAHARQRATWDSIQATLKTVREEVARQDKLAEEKAKGHRTRSLELNRDALLDIMPEWKNTARAKRDVDGITKYLGEIGLDPSVLTEALADNPAWLVMMRNAAAYDRAKKARKGGASPKPKPVRKVQSAGGTQPGAVARERESTRSTDQRRVIESDGFDVRQASQLYRPLFKARRTSR